jgi:hypothetical protein
LIGDRTTIQCTERSIVSPRIAWSGRKYGIVWRGHAVTEERVLFTLLEPGGTPAMEPVQVSTRESGGEDIEFEPDITWTGRNWSVFWLACYDCYSREEFALVYSRIPASGVGASEDGLFPLVIDTHHGLPMSVLIHAQWTGSLYGLVLSYFAPDFTLMMSVDGDGSSIPAGPLALSAGPESHEEMLYHDLLWMEGPFAAVSTWHDPGPPGTVRMDLELRDAQDLGVEWEVEVDEGDWIRESSLAWTGSTLGVAWSRSDEGDSSVNFALFGFCL